MFSLSFGINSGFFEPLILRVGISDKLQALGAYKLINLNLKRQKFWKRQNFASKEFCVLLVIKSKYYCAVNTTGMDTRGAC